MVATTDLHLEVDWGGLGDWSGDNDDITSLLLSLQTATGRDNASSLTGKASPGKIRALLNNSDDRFSPFNASSVLSVKPTFVAAGTSSTANGSAPTPGLPAGMALGDYMVCYFYSREVTDGTVAISDGWREFYNHHDSGGLLGIWGRPYQTGDVAPTFTLTGIAAGDDCIAHIAAWSHVNLARPLGVKGTIATNGSAQNIGAITGLTLGANGLLIVVGGKLDDWTSVATLSQTGLTFGEIGEPAAATGNDAGLVWDYGTADDGSETTISSKTFTVTGGASAAGKGVMFTLNPESLNRPGPLVRLRDDTDVLMVGKLTKVVPDVQAKQIHTATLEAEGLLAEAANMGILPLSSGTGDKTGTLIAAALVDAGLDDSGIAEGDVITGPFGSTATSASLLDELRKLEETERGFLYEDQEDYRLIFESRSHRESVTSSSATFSDDPNDTLHYEGVVEEDWSGYIFNRCIAGVSPYTLGDEAVLVTLPGPYDVSPGGSVSVVAPNPSTPVGSWNGHTRDVYYGALTPAFVSIRDTSLGSVTATKTVNIVSTVNAGDGLLLFFITDEAIINTPTGWRLLFSDTYGDGSQTAYLYGRVADGTEDGGTVVFTLANASGLTGARMWRLSSSYWDILRGVEVSSKVTDTVLPSIDPPSITPSWGAIPTLFITTAFFTAFYNLITEYPSGYTEASANGGYGISGTPSESPFGLDAYRIESTGVTTENPGVFTVGQMHHAEFTLAIKGNANAPTFQDNRTLATGFNTTHNFKVNTTVNANDLILLIIEFDDNVTVTSGTPAGYTSVLNTTVTINGLARRVYILAKNAAGTEDDATINVTTSGSASGVQNCYRFSNWGGTVASHVVVSSFSSSSYGNDVTPQPITPAFGSAKEAFIVLSICEGKGYFFNFGLAFVDLNAPSGYTGWTQSRGNGTQLDSLVSAYRIESTGVTTETPGVMTAAWDFAASAFTFAIRGGQNLETDVTGTTPTGHDPTVTMPHDASIGAGTEVQTIVNVEVTGTPLVQGDSALAQADYLPSQDSARGGSVRTYRNPSNLFVNISDAQDYADEVVKDFGEARPVLSITYMANKDDTHYAQAIARKVGDRITLKANQDQPGAGLGISEDFFIEAIFRDITKTRHQVTYQLSPASVSDL